MSAWWRFVACCVLATVFLAQAGLVLAQTRTFDDFPEALSNYLTGGWQGPFGDGTGGTIFPTADGQAIYMDGTVNALAFAYRMSPEFSDFEATMRFVIAKRDSTEADRLFFHLRWNDPVFPTCCNFGHAASGIWLDVNVGRNSLRVFAEEDYQTGSTLTAVPVNLFVGVPYEIRISYVGDRLMTFIDSVQVLDFRTRENPAGLFAFHASRLDLIVDWIAFNGQITEPKTLVVEPSGSFDYLFREGVPIRIIALVKDATTQSPVSGADVTIEIYDQTNSLWVSDRMSERVPASGMYEWSSGKTIRELNVTKGVFLARIQASFEGGPTAHAVILFHIDPPAEADSPIPGSFITLVAIATVWGLSLATVATGALVSRIRRGTARDPHKDTKN